jgi:glutathione S-transferase
MITANKMIEIWGRKNAYNVQKVIWTLHELNLEYIHHDVGSTPGELETGEFLSMNPHARIPVILDNKAFIWESNTITRYLAASYGRNSLWDDNPINRSKAERWMDWELATLQPDFIDLFWGYYRTPEKKRDISKIAVSKARCEHHFQILNEHLNAQSFVAGESFTMGDIPCATGLYRYFGMGLDVERPEYLNSWYERLSEREAFKQCIMTPFDELRGREHF